MDSTLLIVAGTMLGVSLTLCGCIAYLLFSLLKADRQYQGTIFQLAKNQAEALQGMRALTSGDEGQRAWAQHQRNRGLSPSLQVPLEDGEELTEKLRRASGQGSLVVSAGFPEPEPEAEDAE